MLTKEKQAVIQSLVETSTTEELIWIKKYITELIGEEKSTAAVSASISFSKKLTIVYGTETGNSKKLATDFATKAKRQEIQTKLLSLEQYRLNDLLKEELFITVISTQGEGEPPAAAQKFYDHIHQNGFQLPNMQYAVLALGDTSYPLFCKAGEDVDAQLSKLGGKRIVPIQKCDVEYETEAEQWFDNLLKGLNFTNFGKPDEKSIPVATKEKGKTIYKGTVLGHINLNDRGSHKETWHIEITAEGLTYESGDSIGIVPKNREEFVEEILQISKIDPDQIVIYKTESRSSKDLLINKLNISNLNEKTIQRYAEITKQAIPLTKTDLLELLIKYPLQNAEQFLELIQVLNPQSPRLYTVSSSPVAMGEEVHITVARDIFLVDQKKKFGRCSDFLSGIKVDDTIEFFVQKNKRFKLPTSDKDIIMIGPGTGIAAFRGFLAERDAIPGTGRSWLFFGEQHFASDFLYQTEIQNWATTGTLTKVSVAFSRDQAKKIYVQHRMLESGAELYQWMQGGAYIYVCGKKDPMSNDVEQTLIQIVQQFGNKTFVDAKLYLNELKDSHRYHKDVY